MAEDDNVDSQGCRLRRNTGMGTGSGLELFLAPSDPDDDMGPMGQRTLNGVTVCMPLKLYWMVKRSYTPEFENFRDIRGMMLVTLNLFLNMV